MDNCESINLWIVWMEGDLVAGWKLPLDQRDEGVVITLDLGEFVIKPRNERPQQYDIVQVDRCYVYNLAAAVPEDV